MFGKLFLNPCGIIILNKIVRSLRPTVFPASICPLSTELYPARITSDKYEPVCNVNVKITKKSLLK